MNRIKELRVEQAIKQIDLCKAIGVTQGTLSGWENEKYEPDIKSLQKLAEYFSVSIDYLLGFSDTRRELSIDKQPDGVEFTLAGEAYSLTDAEKQDVIDFIRFKKQQRASYKNK